jgi:hypothetical protein
VASALATDASELVRLAGAGDEHAWARLVDRFTPMQLAIARSYRLPAPDVR